MDIFEILRKLKAKNIAVCVQPGRVSVPLLGLAQTMSTGIDSGAYWVQLFGIPEKGSRFAGLASDDTIRLVAPTGASLTLPVEQAPAPEPFWLPADDARGIQIPSAEALDWIASAVSSDDCRTMICGMRVDGDTLVGTNGHRLHQVMLPYETGVPAFTLSGKYLPFLKVADGWMATETHSWIVLGDVTIRTEHLGAYPDYRQVIPSAEGKAPEVFDAQALHDLHATAAKIKKSARSTAGVRWTTPDASTLHVDFKSGDVEWSQSMARDGTDAPDFTGFDPRYIADAVGKKTKGKVAVVRPDQTSAALIGLPALPGTLKRRAVIMPMRL